MYKSEAIKSKKEFSLIDKPEHIAKLTQLLEKNFEAYFNSLINNYRSNDSLEKLKKQWGKNIALKTDGECIREIFAYRIDEFEKEAEKYREAFAQDNLEDCRHDENSFKDYLIKRCPVITKSWGAQNVKELDEWRKLFAMTPTVVLLDTFENLINFTADYLENYDETEYGKYLNADNFNFNEIEEHEYSITGVIGMGIKAITIYHLYPHIFPKRGKLDLFGMYFLTNQNEPYINLFHFPTKTSEFIMINDETNGKEGTYKADQNYWYPYGLFTSYAMKLYRMIVEQCKKMNVALDPHYRYVYVNTYLENISKHHSEDIKTLTKSSDITHGKH